MDTVDVGVRVGPIQWRILLALDTADFIGLTTLACHDAAGGGVDRSSTRQALAYMNTRGLVRYDCGDRSHVHGPFCRVVITSVGQGARLRGGQTRYAESARVISLMTGRTRPN